jgi:hypothetical protein
MPTKVMATVIVKARFCDKTHRVSVNMCDNGDLNLHIESDCDHVMQYAENIGPVITMTDVTDRCSSRIFDENVQEPLTMTCLAPIAILDAAWLELGMMSVNRAKQIGSDEISFEEVDND